MKEKTAKSKLSGGRQPFGKYLIEQLKTRPAVTAIMSVYFGFCIASAIYFPIAGRIRDVGFALLYAAAVPAFYVGEYFTRQKTPWLCVALIMFWLFGSFIGACYNVYTHVKKWDDIMHFFWGLVFAAAGFAVIKVFMGEPDSNKKFFGCLIFAFAFCIMIAVFWEIFEFAVDRISPDYDMQEDTVIFNIHSFMLYPGYDHMHTEQIDGITKTIIYYGDGKTYEIEGYLDIGLMDTMWDIIWCNVSAGALCIALVADRFCGKHFYKLIIPSVPQKPAASVEVPAQPVSVPAVEHECEEKLPAQTEPTDNK